MNVGEILTVEIEQILDDGRGTAFLRDGRILIIENIGEDDTSITIKITKIGERTIFAQKMSDALTKKKTGRPPNKATPYEIDDDEDEEDDD